MNPSDRTTRQSSLYLISALAAALLALGGCGPEECEGPGCSVPPPGSSCSASNCNGCCQGNTCIEGTAVTACGINGSTCTSCPAGYSCSSGVCKGCTTHAQCATTTDVCVGGACATGLGKTYKITIQSVTVPSTDPQGEAWDAFGGAPDPYVCMYLDGANDPVACSATVDDVFTATWNHTFEFELHETTKVRFLVWDEDVSAADAIAFMGWDGTGFLSAARAGGFEGTLEGVTWKGTVKLK